MAETGTLQSFTWVHDIGWTLVHSVWQLALIAAVYGCIAFILRDRAALVRYVAGCAALLATLAAPVGTFAWLHWQNRTDSVFFSARPEFAFDARAASNAAAAGTQHGDLRAPAQSDGAPITPELEKRLDSVDANGLSNRLRRWVAWLDAAMPWLSGAWFAGVLAMALRPLSGWITVHRLRTQGHARVSVELQKVAAHLVDRMAVRQGVAFVRSSLVDVPAVVGYLRPIVLLPATAVTGLSAEQLEMILAHELAHIRRHDYLVNAAQTMIESLLFFHPAVWWVSARVRAERENCCDDIAIAVCGSPVTYARALWSLETLRARPISLTVGANGGSLLDRIRRIVSAPGMVEPTFQRNAAWLGGLFVVFAMSLALGVLTYNVGAVSAREQDQQANDEESPQTNDAMPAEVQRALAEIKRLGGHYDQMRNDGGSPRVVSVSLAATKVTDEELALLAPLRDLHSLVLNRTAVTDAGLKHLQGMKQLALLELEGSPIKGPGLANLTDMEHLLSLRLGRTEVDDAGLIHVMGMKGLQELWVQKTRITQAGLRELWNVRPALTVVGGDKLEPGDPAEAAGLLRKAAIRASVRDQMAHLEKRMLVLDALQIRDQRVQSFRFEWKARHREPPGNLKRLDNLRLDGPTNQEEVVYELEKKLVVDRRKVFYEFSGSRPKIDNSSRVVMRREIYRSAFDGKLERSVFEYPDSGESTQGFEQIAGISASTNLAETAPLLWTFCMFDEAMVSHDLRKLAVLDEPATINGRPCLVLTGKLRPVFIGSQEHPTQHWYVDAEREYSIVRHEKRTADGHVTFRTDIDHHHDQQWGWVPAKWTILRTGVDGKLHMSVEATVTQYEINPTLPDEVFALKFPENTHMNRP